LSAPRRALVLWFDDVRNIDVPIVGGKNASLGEMINAGLPVPNGFAVTAFSYEKFIEEKQIAQKIYDVIKETVTDPNDPKQYELASKRIREIIEKTPFPKDIEKAIREAYKKLNKRFNLKETFVAVRSSATAEDLPDASFAGQQETYLNVKVQMTLSIKLLNAGQACLRPEQSFIEMRKALLTKKCSLASASKKWLTPVQQA